MKVAVLTPLAPVRTGIASYSAMLLPALAARAEVTAVVDQDEWIAPERCGVIHVGEFTRRREEFDAVVAQLGNNPWHEWIYREALDHPTFAVLHDAVLHHLIVEMTLAKGDAEGYEEILRRNHGEAGAAFARGRAAGLHAELGNFLFPASVELANRSRAAVVHNEWAAARLRQEGVRAPIHVVQHPMRFDEVGRIQPARARERLGYHENDVVVGMFGFVTSAKRPEVVMEAFASASRREGKLRLLVVGEPAPNVDLGRLAERFGVETDKWQATGYVSDDEFDEYLAATDRVVNLRYPSAGETSGALIRILATGKPVAVSDYAQFAEYPAPIVTKIPFAGDEVDRLASFMLADDVPEMADARREWIRMRSDVDRVVERYLEVLREPGKGLESGAVEGRIPLFPQIELDRVACVPSGRSRARLELMLRNRGPGTLRSCVYGEPEYRVIATVRRGSEVVTDRWLALPGDLYPGESVMVGFDVLGTEGPLTIGLAHGLEGIPVVERESFASKEIVIADAR